MVEELYKCISVDHGSLGHTHVGWEEIEKVLVPTTMEPGLYRITLLKEQDRLYRIKGTDFYLKLYQCSDSWQMAGLGTTVILDTKSPSFGGKGCVSLAQ